MSNENWYPSEEEYTPNLSKDDWLELLQDEKIFDYNSMCLMHRLKDIGGQATCKQLADKYGKTPSAYVAYEKALAKRILDNSNCNVPENVSRFSILFLGKWDRDNIHYIWKLRPELSAALDEIDLTKYELYAGKEVEIEGLWTRDRTDWKSKLLKDIAQAKSKYSVIWWLNQISGWTDKNVRNLLKKLISNENGFWIYYVANNFVTHRAHIIDFSEKEEYKNHVTDWKQKNPIWFSEDFKDYCDDKNKERSASVVFLADKFEAIDKKDSFSADCFQEYYKIASRTNMVAYKYITQGDTTMPNTNDKIDDYKNLLEANRNLILHGTPGTGKTHTAKDIAAQMICGKSYAEVEKDDALKKLFNEQTEFVQFHPSYDYSDLVEGLRPKNDGNGNVGFELQDGVFKKFCEKALKANYNDGVDNFDEAWEKLFEHLNEGDIDEIKVPSIKYEKVFNISLNATGTGLMCSSKSGAYFSKEQLYNVYQGRPGVPSKAFDNIRKAVVAKMKSDFGLKDYKVGTETVKKKNFIFIIDEINRGEMSKIFGELFFSIDPDYRGTKGKVRTQYANMLEETNDFDDALGITTSYGHFFVPENVYIIGTMNDIDRSVDSMDFAMRRRFTFMELKANECLAMLDDLQLSDGISKDDIIAKMAALNSEIEKIPGLSSAYHIGGSYFAKLSKYADKPKDEAYKCLWNNHLKPLLTDYLRGLPNLDAKLSSFKTKYDEAEFVAPKNYDE